MNNMSTIVTDLFLLRLALSFVVGGTVVTGFTVLAGRLGSRLGGLIASLPTTLAVSLLFQAITINPEHAAMACPALLAATGMFGIYVTTYIFLLPRSFRSALAGAIVCWLVVAMPIALLHVTSMAMAGVIFAIIVVLTQFGLYRLKMEEPPIPLRIKFSPLRLTVRFLVAAVMISFSVLMGALSGPVWGGIFAAFPAAATSSLIFVHHDYGDRFSAYFLRSMLIGSAFNCGSYILCVYFLYPTVGIVAGTVAAYAAAFATAFIINLLSRRPRTEARLRA